MTVDFYTNPFEYCVVKDDILIEQCADLYKQCINTTADYSKMFINGIEQHNDVLRDVQLPSKVWDHLHTTIENIRNKYFAEGLPEGTWSFSITESNLSDTAPVLTPHTDNPEELYSHGAENAGYLKFVLYIADDIEYPDYGTKLYTLEEGKGFKMYDEIPYVNGTLLVWKPGPNSYHGTDFCTTKDHRRFFICGEYIENEKLLGME